MKQSQLNADLAGQVIISAGKYTLERTRDGDLVVTDGWRADWIFIYNACGTWAHDGVFNFRKEIRRKVDSLAKKEYYNYLRGAKQ
jgi:hypothetical protein